jgi:hypothetical protein
MTGDEPDGAWYADEPAGSANAADATVSGRHREHLFPGRPRRVAPTFTAQEYAIVVAAAARAGLTPTGFCARAALTVAARGVQPRPGPHASPRGERVAALGEVQTELADLRVAVVRVGTNLNQAVRVLNATGQVPVWLEHVVAVCARALGAVDAAAAAVDRRLW